MAACDHCVYLLHKPSNVAIYDAKTVYGPWANLCEEHFQTVGVGLGTGKGSRLPNHPEYASKRSKST